MTSYETTLIYEPRYDVTSAAHHLRIPRSTLDSWVNGMGSFKPVLDLPKPRFLSFVNLTEAFVLSALRRRYKIKMHDVRSAVAYVGQQMGVTHPLAYEPFQTDYVHLFVRHLGQDVNASRGGQTVMTAVLERLDRIEWRDDRPIALFPITSYGKNAMLRPISISPLVAFGDPVLRGTRISIRAVADRFFAGEAVAALAEDFGVTLEAIEEAVRAERESAAA